MGNLNYQITDLTLTEQREVNGGAIWHALAIALAAAIITDWDNFKAGLSGKPELAKKQYLKNFKIIIMGTTNYLQNGVKELSNEDLLLVSGGGFAYDLGFFLRELIIYAGNGGNCPGSVAVAADLGLKYRPVNQ